MSRVFDASQTGANETYLLTPPNPVYNNLSAWTLAAWVYPTASDGFGIIFVKDPQVSYDIFFNLSSLALNATINYSSAPAGSGSVETIPLNTWSHISATFNFAGDAKIHLYINGVEVTYAVQDTASGILPDDSAHGWAMGNDILFDDGYTGRIAEAVIYNEALTSGQVASLAASTTGATVVQPSHIVGYWHLFGTQSPEPDSSGNNDPAALSINPPTAGPNPPGWVLWSQPDCRNYFHFPNASRNLNGTLIYDVQTSSNASVPGIDSRTAGAPVASRTYPQNSRTPGTFGPGE